MALRRRLFGLLIVALAHKCKADLEDERSRSMLIDMGYDGCPVCDAARAREAWLA